MVSVHVEREKKYTEVSGGIGIGTIIAMYLSWTMWHSIPWVIVHGLISWVYIVYFFFMYGFDSLK